MSNCCPSCGYNLRADEVIERGRWRLDPRGSAYYNGARLRLSKTQSIILHDIAASRGREVTREALLGRTSDGENLNNVCAQVCRLRQRLARLGVPDPIQSRWGAGYYWRDGGA